MRGAGIDPAVLASAPPGYRLAITDNQYDLGRFISHKDAGLRAAAAAQFEQASRRLSAALAECGEAPSSTTCATSSSLRTLPRDPGRGLAPIHNNYILPQKSYPHHLITPITLELHASTLSIATSRFDELHVLNPGSGDGRVAAWYALTSTYPSCAMLNSPMTIK